jgi:hypothetical protein
MKTPSTMDRDERSIITLTVKSTAISLIVNSDTRWRATYRRDLKNHWRDVHMHGFGVDVPLRHTLSLTHMKVLA